MLTDDKGEKTIEKIVVWKDENKVYYERKGAKFCKPIISEDAPVDMELPLYPGPFTVSATGGAWDKWSGCLGDFSLTEELLMHNDRPVYKNSKDRYLCSTARRPGPGAWAVGGDLSRSNPVFRSIDLAPSPALCQKWEYLDNGYKPGDVKITIKM